MKHQYNQEAGETYRWYWTQEGLKMSFYKECKWIDTWVSQKKNEVILHTLYEFK